jgi:hypothetical protein
MERTSRTNAGADDRGSAARPTWLAAHRWDGVQQPDELRDVVAVAAGDLAATGMP